MRPAIVSFALAFGLASCAPGAREVPLANLNLNDARTLANLQRGLSTRDSGALALYALRHWPQSRAFCGEAVLDRSGRLPRTVGEAIRLTKAREEAEAAAALARARPASPGEKLLEQRDLAISQRDALVARQQVTNAMPGSSSRRRELALIENELEEVDRQLRTINSRLESNETSL